MTGKSLLTAGALVLATVGLASAKTYEIDLLSAAKAGPVDLNPGEYTLKINGSEAILKDTQSGKSFTVPVKVENSATKFSATQVETAQQNGADMIQAIDLAGSHTRLMLAR